MSDNRPLASLSSSLLARKGQAKPAMRPQAIIHGHNYSQGLEDLGWNDMGHDADPVPLPGVAELPEPAAPVVHDQQHDIARSFASLPPAEEPEAAEPDYMPVGNIGLTPSVPVMGTRAPRAAPGTRGKAAFTLRLDGERHLKLRLVCAVKHKSAQQLVTQALDEFLARQPEIADLPLGKHN